MLTIKKTYTWEMGHALFKVGKEDKCYSPHGHNYRLIVEVAREDEKANPDTDMVINFHELDRYMDPLIEENDHKFYFNEDDDRFGGDDGYIALYCDPTAEALCQMLWGRLEAHFNLLREPISPYKLLPLGVKLISLELFETDKASAKIYCS
tara:strand:- start:738 stop:1190 length:453 start_codon:yes stop_codon:yes gene_type:complete